MKVRCISNDISSVSNHLKRFAFNQDQYGIIDITIDKVYDVYGIQENKLGVFYLVLTDEINNDIPWWMPSDLYVVEDSTRPKEWTDEIDDSDFGGKYKVSSFDIYFGAEEDIEDGTEEGYKVFAEMVEMNAAYSKIKE